MKQFLYILITFVFIRIDFKAQDAYFINNTQSLAYLNPAFAGSNGKFRNQNNYLVYNRNSVAANFTYLSSVDFYIKRIKGGLALSLFSDVTGRGVLKTNYLSIAYAQHLSFMNEDLKIIPAVEISYNQKKLDVNALNFGSIIDPRYNLFFPPQPQIPSPQKNYWDLNAGLLFNYKSNYYFGLAAKHLTGPDIGLGGTYKLPMLLNLHASTNFCFGAWTNGNFSIRYFNQMGKNYMQEHLNLIWVNHVVFGFGIINGYSTPFFNIGYKSKNFNTQLLYQGNPYHPTKIADGNQSFELSLSVNLKDKKNPKLSWVFESW